MGITQVRVSYDWLHQNLANWKTIINKKKISRDRQSPLNRIMKIQLLTIFFVFFLVSEDVRDRDV